MVRLVLEYKKTVEQNASAYFEKAKKAKRKIEGAKKALSESKKKLALLKIGGDKLVAKEEKTKNVVERKVFWYEKFRWFISSEGFLCIGGRDATTNEIVVKKHAEKNDIILHTDMAGSPFVIIKVPDEKRPSEQTLQEAADFEFSHSKAWKLGMASVEVFWVNPDQVSKEAQSGEFLPKGAFMIRGKTNYLSPKPNYAVGNYGGAIMGGPVSAVKFHCKEIIEIVQGSEKQSDIAKIVQKKLGGKIDEIIRVLPIGIKIKK